MTQTFYHPQLNERELLSRLVLNASDAARVCGITTRQLTYWTDKGIIESQEGDNRSYGVEALERAVLIRKAMDSGYTLEKAAELVNQRLAAVEDQRSRYQDMDQGVLAEEVDRHLMRLEKSLAALRVRLPTYLALCRLLELGAEIQRLPTERLLEESSFDPRANEILGQRLESAIEGLKRVLEEAQRGLVLA